MATVPIPQGASVGAPALVRVKQQMDGPVPIPQGATVGDQPNSVLGGAGRRLKSMFSSDGDRSLLENMLESMPGLSAGVGLYQAERQLGPQLVQQMRDAAASHRGDKSALSMMMPNLQDARAATTGASMLDPFATGPVANINQLQGEGRYREAAGQGLTDAALLAAGGAAPKVIPPVTRGIGRVASAAPGIIDPDILGLVSPRAAHAVRLAGKIGRVATKLGGSAAPEAAPAQPAAPTQSFSPQPLARPELVPSPGRYTTSPYADEGIPTSEATDPRTDVFANYGAPEAGPAPAPASMDMSKYYGKTPTRSNLKANQRQLASPTASTAPVSAPYPPRVMNILNSPVEPTDADILEIQQAVRQRRLVDQMP